MHFVEFSHQKFKKGILSMKKLLLLSFALLLVTTTVFAANFAPTLLKITAPAQVQYNFDGKDLQLPVTLTGTPAGVNFFVFTKGKAATISKITNGFLGWHYVNKVDTCIYFSQQTQFAKGNNNLVWNGKDKNGVSVPKGDYTYYLWGFDNVNSKVPAAPIKAYCVYGDLPVYVEHDPDGKVLANPIWWSKTQKWTFGGDTADATLIETSDLPPPEGYENGHTICLQPDDYGNVFQQIGKADTNEHGIAKYKWTPNGMGVLDTDWADNGMTLTTVASWTYCCATAGVQTDGNYLYTIAANIFISDAESDFRVWDIGDGTLLKKIDISNWWSSVEDKDNGGQMNSGPNIITIRNGLILLGSHVSCLNQVVDPVAGLDDEEELILWSNGNSDHIGDRNDDPATAKVPWMCNDWSVGPYKYSFVADANLFCVFPSFDMGAVSFGLLAPDGTGVQYLAYAGETAAQKYEDYFCDNGSAFDGLYTDNATGAVTAGIWFVAQDSFKGVISSPTQTISASVGPAAFELLQNVPNPFNPSTTITYALDGATRVALVVYNVQGQKVRTLADGYQPAGVHSVVWDGADDRGAKVSSGVYLYRLSTPERTDQKRMLLVR